MSEYEKSADELETASHLQEQMNLAGRRAAEAAMAPQTHPDFDGAHCLDCDVDMPAVRLAYGRIRCTACQVAADKLAKLRRR